MIVEIIAIAGLLICTIGFFIYENRQGFEVYRIVKFAFHICILVVMVFHWKNISNFKNDVEDSIGFEKSYFFDILTIFRK